MYVRNWERQYGWRESSNTTIWPISFWDTRFGTQKWTIHFSPIRPLTGFVKSLQLYSGFGRFNSCNLWRHLLINTTTSEYCMAICRKAEPRTIRFLHKTLQNRHFPKHTYLLFISGAQWSFQKPSHIRTQYPKTKTKVTLRHTKTITKECLCFGRWGMTWHGYRD